MSDLSESSPFWRSTPDRSFILKTVLLYFLFHGALWDCLLKTHGQTWTQLLESYDSGWYNSIISQGYGSNPRFWAFFPLYPTLIGWLTTAVQTVTHQTMAPQILGTLFSSLVFLISVLFLIRSRTQTSGTSTGLFPMTRMGWFLFLFSPASYVFHSHHTESLFLLLSLLAFWAMVSERWVLSSLMAGLASLTRIQGIFIAASVGIYFLLEEGHLPPSSRKINWKRFLACGGLSALVFLIHFLNMTWKTQDPLTLFKVQAAWSVNGPLSILRVLRTLWFGNPSQTMTLGPVLHYLFTIGMSLSGVLFLKRKQRSLALYCFLSLGIMLIQGHFGSAYRFCAVLYPAFFVIGDSLAKTRASVSWIFICLWFLFNGVITTKYALNTWPY